MENHQQSSNLLPLTIDDIKNSIDRGLLPIDEKTLQLQVDAINVLENRVDINIFPPSYRKKIEDYYRFSPRSKTGRASIIACSSVKRIGKG